MSTLKILINKEVESYIENFYNLIDFLSKYGYVVVTFILSIIIVFSFSFNQNNDVIAYSSTNILDLSKLSQNYIWYKNPEIFNKKVKYLSANYILSSTYIKKWKIYLWEGLFTDNLWFYYPNWVVIPISILPKNNLGLRRNLARYYLLLSKVNGFTFKQPKILSKKWISIIDMKKKYNLHCLDTVLDNSIFCNTNKYILLNKIEKGEVDLSKQAYDYLFKHIYVSSEKKCNLLKKIYSKNYNYKNIEWVVNEYCDNSDEFKSSYEIIKLNNNIFSDNIPSTYDAQMVKLVNQWEYFLQNNNIPNENIISHVNFVKKLLMNGFFTQKEAYIEMSIINDLKNKIVNNINYNNLINMLNLLIYGDKIAWIPGIKSFIGNMKLISSSDSIIYKSDNIRSVREKFLSLIRKKYAEIFILSKKVTFNSENNTAKLEWYLVLSVPQGNNLSKKKKILVSFIVPLSTVIWDKFKVYKFKILDNSINNYLDKKKISYPVKWSLISIYNKLNEVLANYVLNNKIVNISFCDMIKNKINHGSCSGNTIVIVGNKIQGLFVKYVFNNSHILKEVILPKEVRVSYRKGWGNEPYYIKVPLYDFDNNLNKLISKKMYSVNDINLIFSVIKKYINKYKKVYESRQIWMDPSNLINLETLLKKYLWAKLVYVKHLKKSFYDVYFILNWYKFESIYDLQKNKFYALYLVISRVNKKFEFKVKLSLSDLDLEKLNAFKVNPIDFLKNINSQKVDDYQKTLEEISK